jgi:hypothetical protein
MSSVSQNVLKFYQQLTGEERRICFIFYFIYLCYTIKRALAILLCIFVHMHELFWLVGWLVFNATFNNISFISWQSVLLVEETGGPGENHRPAASH